MPKRDVPRRIDLDPPVMITTGGIVLAPSIVGSYLMSDGSVALAGNMAVLAGVTIDGVDISELALMVERLTGDDTAPRTGYTVMSHGSNLADTIYDWSAIIRVWDDIFAINEQVAVSDTAGNIELMRVTGAATLTVNIDGADCYEYPVTRRVTTSPAGLNQGWLKGTAVSGLTFDGYVAFDNRSGKAGSPSMRVVQWLDNPPTATEHILRAGELSGVLDLGASDFGFAVGRLTTADRYLLFNAATGVLSLHNSDLEVFGETGERVFWVQGASGDNAPGYTVIGAESGGHFVVDPGESRVGIWLGDQEVLWFDAEDGSRITGLLSVGEQSGPQIQLGQIDLDAILVARNQYDVAQFMVRARADTGNVYVFAGNPKPQGNWIEFDEELTVDGTIRARGGVFLGELTFASTGEVKIQDPDDPRRYGHIKPHYLAGYSVDGTDTQHLSSLIAWAPATLEAVPGSGVYKTWLAGEGFFGDWRYRHFRWERNGRVGLFDGETPKAWMDYAGDFHASGEITALSGTIGGWIINTDRLRSADDAIQLLASGGIILDALIAKFDESSIRWMDGTTDILRIGTNVDLGIVIESVVSSSKSLLIGCDEDISLQSDAQIYLVSNLGGSGTSIIIDDKAYIGGTTNGFYVNEGGHAGWIGTGKRKLTMRPTLVAGRISGAGSIPTAVAVGAHAGYSLPIWSTPANQYEELYFREYIAGRWDGASDITVSLLVALAAAETAGEDFRFQLSWESVPVGAVLTTGTTDVEAQKELVDASQYATYRLDFTIDWDLNAHDITASDHFACRIRRVAATGVGADEVDGEVIVLDCIITYTVDKVYKAP